MIVTECIRRKITFDNEEEMKDAMKRYEKQGYCVVMIAPLVMIASITIHRD